MLLDRQNWPPHRPWVIGCALALVAACAWFLWAAQGSADWPGGSSEPGFAFGVLGGLIILFECFLWVRKRWLRVWRIGRTKEWLRAHIWLGLLCLPILILHSGLRWGGPLSTVLLVLLIIVVASGVGGLLLQIVLPRKMLDEIPAETIHSQIDYLAGQLIDEADRLVSATCGTGAESPAGVGVSSQREDLGPRVVGAVRTVGNVQGKVLDARGPTVPVAESEGLAKFYREQVMPFLRQGPAGNRGLAKAGQAAIIFQNIRTHLPPAAHDAVAILESFCDQRRQWDTQARMHFLLHSWLWVHFPLSIALVVLMFVHVFVTLKYW